jgi:transposase
MPGPRLPMRKIRDVLRLSAAGMSKRKIAASLGVSATAAGDCIRRARRAGLGWPLAEDLKDETLELRLYPPAPAANDSRPQPNWAAVHRELRARLSPTMRQNHVAGERMFVDYAGTTLEVIDASTGEAMTAQLFVAVLGASNYTYAEATWTQGLSDWIGSHTRTLRSWVVSRRWWCPTICGQASPRPASTSRRSTAPMPRWQPTTTPPLCRRGHIGRVTRRRLKWRSKWRLASG